MAEIKKRKVHSAEFKGKVSLEAVRGVKTVNEIAQQHGVHPAMVAQWKKELISRAGTLFEGKRGPKAEAEHQGEDRLYGEIGHLKMELDWLKKKVRPVSGAVRLGWIEAAGELSLVRQCELAGISRATVYRPRVVTVPDNDDLVLCALIDEEFTRHPFYSSRRMVVILKRQGWLVNRKHVQRLMRILGLAGMAPGPGTPVPRPGHKVYPYLLRGVAIVRPNQVWSTDITYIRLARGFAYLVAIIEWYSRRVLTWRISNSMDAPFCVDRLEEALIDHGTGGAERWTTSSLSACGATSSTRTCT
jgi:putative transposase